MRKNFLALIAAAALLTGMSACSKSDNPAEPTPSEANIPAQLKQGVWTEYDTVLVAAGKNTMEELAEMPAVGMVIEGDKAYFFTYNAEETSDPVEGKVTYDKTTGKGSITFPAIKDNPLSGQTVSFTATSDETLEFELNYGGVKTTAACVWLCENLDNWDAEITDEDWKALMAYYEQYAADAGPDPSIDWSNSDVEGLDKPLVWDESALAPARTRAAGAIIEGVFTGLEIFTSLFEPDPYEKLEEIEGKIDKINENLAAVNGKIDRVLAGQEKMMKQMNLQFDKVNDRLNAIAETMKKDKILDIFNERNKTYYNPLKNQNVQYFNKAYKLYSDNKSDLSKVSADLREYAELWMGAGEKYLDLTWSYIEYLATVQNSYYGTGMAKIYDGLTFEKYPWEHMGLGDRQSYRAYDMFEISKCLFMINLYTIYGGLSDKRKEGLYLLYREKLPKVKAFCNFTAADPNEYLVCQIPGAHFVMHKELQKYNYCGENNKCPSPFLPGHEDAIYRPEWHEVGKVKIDNPEALRSKLIRQTEAEALLKYYGNRTWGAMLVGDAGAEYAKAPTNTPILILYDNIRNSILYNGLSLGGPGLALYINPVMDINTIKSIRMGYTTSGSRGEAWESYDKTQEYYMAIVQERY